MSFTEVLNGLYLKANPRRDTAAGPVVPPDRPGEGPRAPEPAGEVEELSGVRPYARTGGRTQPVHELAVETLVITTAAGRDAADALSVEHAPVARLCEEIRSVAEVSALLAVPLGVARVLIADMVDVDLVDVHHNPTTEDGYPDGQLLERVLEGLRKL
ncbi:MAG: DUF742 domain-containing protein [Actinomycetota bacterium]|nr:DUF742 domain-containing protein [Actinomycetota bacterium]